MGSHVYRIREKFETAFVIDLKGIKIKNSTIGGTQCIKKIICSSFIVDINFESTLIKKDILEACCDILDHTTVIVSNDKNLIDNGYFKNFERYIIIDLTEWTNQPLIQELLPKLDDFTLMSRFIKDIITNEINKIIKINSDCKIDIYDSYMRMSSHFKFDSNDFHDERHLFSFWRNFIKLSPKLKQELNDECN